MQLFLLNKILYKLLIILHYNFNNNGEIELDHNGKILLIFIIILMKINLSMVYFSSLHKAKKNNS